MSNLYIVATPIGNLEDISQRALRILSEVDLILCEDTRVTKKLLEHYNIKTPVLSYHQHSKLKKINYILEILKERKPSTRAELGAGPVPYRNKVSGTGNLALVSDAGTPGISDPGHKLIAKLFEAEPRRCPKGTREMTEAEPRTIKIVPIPGPSAVTAAASIAGFSMDKFLFFGFPPTKKKRKKFFEEVVNSRYSVIFYESPYRIIKSLTELRILDEKLEVVVCRELTKKFETVYRGKITSVIEQLENGEIRGEFVIVIERK